jgi:malate permease and related proteins
MSIGELFRLILPVFALIAVGSVLRRFHWIEGPAETSLLRLVVDVTMPCLVFDSIVGNEALREPGNIFLPPLAGFLTTAIGLGVAYLSLRFVGLKADASGRTFALSTGVCNYRYVPIPIVGALWGARAAGVVLIFGMGVDVAIWSLGLLVLTGASSREALAKLVSPMLVTLVAAIAINMTGLSPYVPSLVGNMAHSLGVCAVPMGLIMTGVSVADYVGEPAKLVRWNVWLGSCVVRLMILPVLTLCFAAWLPWSEELRRVLIVEAAMPAAVVPIIIARHYGGNALTSVQVVLATTAVGLVASPLWIRAGLAWLGLA